MNDRGSKRASAMDLLDLRYALIVAETGSILNAADSIGVTSSTVSRRITRFEDELGVTIFERGAFGVRPTTSGRQVLVRVRQALDSVDSVLEAGKRSGTGVAGHVRLGVRMPPVGEPLQSLLAAWRDQNPDVGLTVHELNDHQISPALVERSVDAALVTTLALRRGANSIPIYREPLVAALPIRHSLASFASLTWSALGGQTFLTQGWDNSHAARDFYTSLLGDNIKFSSHPASKQSVMALVGAGFGVTLVVKSQAEVVFPGVVYKTILENDAWVQVELAWRPSTEEAAVGRFVAFMRDEARLRKLL
jgi:DNA-binding transcriptional LysR family regulator